MGMRFSAAQHNGRHIGSVRWHAARTHPVLQQQQTRSRAGGCAPGEPLTMSRAASTCAAPAIATGTSWGDSGLQEVHLGSRR